MSNMETKDIKSLLQNHLSDGLVIVVGSGLSCAEGMPGMGDLANHIIKVAADNSTLSGSNNWATITESIKNKGLEAAFLEHQLSQEMEQSIMAITANFLISSETKIIEEVVAGKKTLRFSRLIPHLLKPNTGIPIITPNYDRLVEVACEQGGLGVDTMFCGGYIGELNEKESRFSLCREAKKISQNIYLKYREHARVYKPHGSFDWYQKDSKPLRYLGNLELPRLIITPGVNKFRNGYESPFDKHREKANRSIESASRFLIIGYGFNDDHLETQLKPAIKSGKPTVLLTQKISDNAENLIKESPSFAAFEQASNGEGTRFLSKECDIVLPESNFWDLNNYINEVLEP